MGALLGCFVGKAGSSDKRPKPPLFDGPKFLSGGPSARLQGARKRLRVGMAEIIGKPMFLVLKPLAGD
jgi:hypothetical protein